MEEIIKSMKAHLYDRIGSPLFGAFAFSWIIWNYKLIIIIFSGASVLDKFQYIANLYQVTHLDLWLVGKISTPDQMLSGVLYPMFTSLLIIFVYPWPALWVYQFNLYTTRKLVAAKVKYHDEKPMDQSEARKLRRTNFDLKFLYDKDLGEAHARIAELTEEVEKLRRPLPPTDGGLRDAHEDQGSSLGVPSVESKAQPSIKDLVRSRLEQMPKGKSFTAASLLRNKEKKIAELDNSALQELLEKILTEPQFRGEIVPRVSLADEASSVYYKAGFPAASVLRSEISRNVLSTFSGTDESGIDFGYICGGLAALGQFPSNDQVRVALDQLTADGFLEKESNSYDGTCWILTPAGRELIVQSGIGITAESS